MSSIRNFSKVKLSSDGENKKLLSKKRSINQAKDDEEDEDSKMDKAAIKNFTTSITNSKSKDKIQDNRNKVLETLLKLIEKKDINTSSLKSVMTEIFNRDNNSFRSIYLTFMKKGVELRASHLNACKEIIQNINNEVDLNRLKSIVSSIKKNDYTMGIKYADPTYDFTFKTLFTECDSSEKNLKSLLNSLLDIQIEKIDSLFLDNPFISGKGMKDKPVISEIVFDVCCTIKDKNGKTEKVGIEVQRYFDSDFWLKIQFAAARLVTKFFFKNKDVKDNQVSRIIILVLARDNLDSKNSKFATKFTLKDEEDHEMPYNMIQFQIFELNKFEKLKT